ncbi:MAG TPA: PsiF family protein [Candidatus Limnocylindrales bacterium]|nr:PsiF family protein [Candidatus Limnocylindrales bacterium]
MHALLTAFITVLLTAGIAAAADPPATPSSPQAQRMKDCSARAAADKLTGEARRNFMSGCLKARPDAGANGAAKGREGAASKTGPRAEGTGSGTKP